MQYIQKRQKWVAMLLCIFFCISLFPVEALNAAEYVETTTTIEKNYYADRNGKPTDKVGEVYQFVMEFGNVSDIEQVVVHLEGAIPIVQHSSQPDRDKIDKIVFEKATTDVYLKRDFGGGKVSIVFGTEITVAQKYSIYVTVNNGTDSITVDGNRSFEVKAGEAVFNRTSPIRSSMYSQVNQYLLDATGENYIFTAEVVLEMQDRFNNITNVLPEGYSLYMRFDRNGRGSKEDSSVLVNTGAKTLPIGESYTHVPIDYQSEHVTGKITAKVTYVISVEEYDKGNNLPTLYAALVDNKNGQIDTQREIYNTIGFMTDSDVGDIVNTPSIFVDGSISIDSYSNEIVIRVSNIYPAAGYLVVVELPKGFINIETGKNTVYFEYADINKLKTVVLSELPSKPEIIYNEEKFKLGLIKKNNLNEKMEETPYLDVDSRVRIVHGPATNGSKGSYMEQINKKAEAKANSSDALDIKVYLQDSLGQIATEFFSSEYLYVWAEREQGKVSTQDYIIVPAEASDSVKFVNTGEKDANGIFKYDNNGVNGVYRYQVQGIVPNNGEIPFAVTSSLDGKVEIKAALATSAYNAVHGTEEDGTGTKPLKKSVKLTFEPYADESGWKFTNVTVKSLKEEYLQSAGKPHHTTYTVMQTKKADGEDTFAITAMLSPWSGEVKLSDEPITITSSSPDLKISAKDKSTQPLENGSGVRTVTGSGGKFSFNLAANKVGTYKVIVQADNATYKDENSNGVEDAGERSGYIEINVTFDEEGGNMVPSGDPESDLAAKLQSVTSIVLEEQSSFLLAPTDTLYAVFKLYDKNKRQVILENDAEVKAAIKNLRFTTKPVESILENNMNSIKAVEDEGGIHLSFVADQRGAYSLEMTLINEKTGKVSFNVDQMNKIIGLELSYPETGLPLGGTSGTGTLTFIDSGGKRIEQALPMEGIRLSASGIPLEQFSKETSVVKARTGDSYSGEIITVKAVDRTRNLTAVHDFVVAHEIITLEFDQTQGELLRDLITNLTMKDSNGRTLPANSLLYDDGGRVRVTVVSKPAQAVINTELVNNGKDFIDLGNNDLKVRSDRIGDVRIRVDVRAIDPHYSQKYPIYAYLTGVANYSFLYPGILDSKPLVEGYDNADATLMYIGSRTYVSCGQIKVMDAAPFIENSRTFIPVRALSDSLGTTVYYNGETQKIYLSNNKDTIVMQIGVPVLTSREKGQIATDVAPFIINGRTYLPVRAISEALDCNVDAVYEGNNIAGVIFAPRK